MAETTCYASVRGSGVRVTSLTSRGSVPEPIQFAVSKAVAKVDINEVTESGSSEMIGSDENDNDNRLRLTRPEETIRYTVDIDFVRVDPGILHLITGVPLVSKDPGPGFGSGPFGEMEFGAPETYVLGFGGDGFGETAFGEEDPAVPSGDLLVNGFDAVTRLAPVSFGLEVWSKLAGRACIDATKQYGYTVFPHLRGGRLTGFTFANGLVSFNIRGAQTRRAPRWNVGPYDLEGPHMRLVEPVSRNTLFRQTLTPAPPPTDVCGIQETEDIIYGGSATVTSDDVIEGGTATDTSPWIIYGGQAV